MISVLLMSSKLTTLGLLKKKIFWNKVSDVIIFAHSVTNKFISLDANYIVDVVMWPRFGNSSISMREVIITSILYGFDQKKLFFEGCFWLKHNNWDWYGYGLEILHQCDKRSLFQCLPLEQKWRNVPNRF